VPIQVEIFHFDRLVVGIGRGVVTLPEYGKFINRARRWKDLYRSDRGGRSVFA